ncbi:beta-1,3-galactosyltransferase 1 isoform X1 [Patella vulgata]|uniref:beta-1,3-galactosyltransferase 1 isoform X1 n=1 Tax=Patella vulgata TaxID=6465 RepID=UPI002180304A|nr:beta-1,3-galactosyltransferase 1 isoform X1 [Patella vulgata]XP_050416401.1 beta-1,3-galactosyltransferase 1 isoform X1 [Patella vulgata]XP_050416402.1 beta-1,3-galactosyltransferase 1 isoform X1 [Patella vulgata]XP_055958726.1 beta-1,3-galactosyltransferase 1 isoform X1 [Patella vulgata]
MLPIGRQFFRKLQSVLIALLIVCVLSLFYFNETTTTHWSRFHEHMMAKLPDYLPNSFRGTHFNITGNMSASVLVPSDDRSLSDVIDRSKEYFREWFDNRTDVEPYVNEDRDHPVVKDFIITNSGLCGDSSVDILIYFHSSWKNTERRRLLRETWASKSVFQNISIKTIFILGKPPDEKSQFAIDLENVVHRDIIQGDFIDSFKNLTLKSAMAIHWINTYCLQARYIIKADDDIFVNIFKIVEDFIPLLSYRNNTVLCHFHRAGASTIVRNPKSKWYIPLTVFEGEDHFPPFCSGYVAIFTSDLIPLLYESSFHAPVIPVDDVYMFGLLPYEQQFMEFIDIRQNLTLNKNLGLKQYGGQEPLTYVGANAWDIGNMEKFWALTLNKLTPWGKRRAAISVLRDNMGLRSL